MEDERNDVSAQDRRESVIPNDVDTLERDAGVLQREYDELIELKHSLKREIEALKQQLTDISNVVRRLQMVRSTWSRYIHNNNDEMGLLVNCLTAAAFLVYGAPADIETRRKIVEYLNTITDHHSLTINIPRVLRDVPLLEFLDPQVNFGSI